MAAAAVVAASAITLVGGSGPAQAADYHGSITPGGSSVPVTLSASGDNGYLTWSGTSGDRVYVKASTGTLGGVGQVLVSILKPDGTQLGSGSGGIISNSVGFVDTQTLPTTGTYSVFIDPFSTTTGTTTVTLYSVPADGSGSITPGGSPVGVTLSTPGQNGALTWSGTSGDRVFVKAITGSLSGAGIHSVYVSVLKPDGSQLGSVLHVVGSSTDGYIDTQSLPSTGTYTLEVDPYQDTTGTTTLTLYSVPADTSGSITPGGSSVGVSLSTPGQNGTLTWSGTSGDRVFVKAATGTLSGAGIHSVFVSILKPDGSTLGSALQIVGSSTDGFVDTQSLPSTGTYTLKVDPYQDTTGTTTVTLYSVPADVSGSIRIDGASVPTALSAPGQNSSLTFAGTGGQQFFLQAKAGSLSGDGLHNVSVSIVKPNGSQLGSTVQLISNGSGSTSALTMPTTGTYTVKVDPYQDTTGTTTVTLQSAFVAGMVPAAAAASRGHMNPAVPGLMLSCQCQGDPVNTENGDFSESTTDASLTSFGPGVSLSRTYDASLAQAQATAGTPGVLGYGWTDNWGMSLSSSSGVVTITQANGAQVAFQAPSGGSCTAPYVGPGTTGTYCALPDVTASLTYDSPSATYTFTTHPYQRYTFDGSGQLTGQSGPGGAALSISYNTPIPGSGSCPSAASSCMTVSSASGRALVIASNSSGEVTSTVDPLGRTWTYTYCSPPSSTCSANDLVSVTDPMGRVTSFTYDETNGTSSLKHDLLTETRPNGQTGGPNAGAKLTNVYDSSGRVTSQTTRTGIRRRSTTRT